MMTLLNGPGECGIFFQIYWAASAGCKKNSMKSIFCDLLKFITKEDSKPL